MLLQLFERDLSESELMDVRRVLMKHFARKAEDEAERILDERNKTVQEIEKDTATLNENRTAYLQQLRSAKEWK